jgi:hypothetical protein
MSGVRASQLEFALEIGQSYLNIAHGHLGIQMPK